MITDQVEEARASDPTFTHVRPDSLRFDPSNPRFAGSGSGKSQDQIQMLLEGAPHLALDLVPSLLENGFIQYEPLVTRKGGDHYVVVEGNRRLAAVRHIIRNAAKYPTDRVEKLARIPVLVFPETSESEQKTAEAEQRVYLGVRHLFGFREWPPESKARFLDQNIKTGEDLKRLERELNIKRADFRRYVVPYRLRKKARDIWAPYKSQDFWILGEGLAREGIKEYIELDVDTTTLQVRGFEPGKLHKLFGFIYGAPGGTPQITDTRQLSRLALVLQSRPATHALEKGRPLDEAELLIESPEASLVTLAQLVRRIDVVLGSIEKRRPVPVGTAGVLKRFKSFKSAVKKFVSDATKPSV
jgi:hypothetical protein